MRIPASHCGLYGLKPTFGEISTRGLVRGARRLDCVGILARSVPDLAVVLQVLDAFDPADPRSRKRRVPLATPANWVPGQDVIVALALDDAAAEAKYGALDKKLPYLRFARDPA